MSWWKLRMPDFVLPNTIPVVMIPKDDGEKIVALTTQRGARRYLAIFSGPLRIGVLIPEERGQVVRRVYMNMSFLAQRLVLLFALGSTSARPAYCVMQSRYRHFQKKLLQLCFCFPLQEYL